MPKPFFSIITPSFNQGQFIEETIDSVLSQDYKNFEFFIIDGGSTDNSVEVIKRYEKYLSGWLSEPDKGQSHALQKGLARARGEWFNWINSDDLLEPGALKEIARYAGDADVIAGHTLNFGLGQEKLVRSQNIALWPVLARALGSGCRWHQPSLWLQTEHIREVGGIDASLHYRFDYDLLARYLQAYPEVKYVDRSLAKFRLHDDSKTMAQQQGFQREDHLVMEKLLALLEFSPWHRDLLRLDEAFHWHDYLQSLLNAKHRNRFLRMGEMLVRAAAKPSLRFDKPSRKFLKRIITLGGAKQRKR